MQLSGSERRARSTELLNRNDFQYFHVSMISTKRRSGRRSMEIMVIIEILAVQENASRKLSLCNPHNFWGVPQGSTVGSSGPELAQRRLKIR